MQFPVPQFIDTEDKVVGPFTLRQFMYIAIGSGACFVLFFLLQTWLWFLISLFILAIAAGLAFAKIEGRPLAQVITSAFAYYWNPQTYVWQTENKVETKTGPVHEGQSSLERIVQGLSIKKAWRSVQTGSSAERKPDTKPGIERYQVFRGKTGENRVARRVDYR